jgi:hypothetical protein
MSTFEVVNTVAPKMPEATAPNPQSDADQLEAAADQATLMATSPRDATDFACTDLNRVRYATGVSAVEPVQRESRYCISTHEVDSYKGYSTCGGGRKVRRGATGLKWTVLALAALTTGPADAGSANEFAQATAHLLDCDVPGGSVRFTPFGDDGVTMNLNLPAAALADTPFAGERIVTSISSPGKSFLRLGVYHSGMSTTAEALLNSAAGGVLSVMVNNDEVNIHGFTEGGGGQQDGGTARLMCNSRKFEYVNGKKVVNYKDANAFALRVMKLLANDIRKNAEAIAPAEKANSKPDGCWLRIGLVDRIGLRKNPDGSATFEMPDTYPTAGIVLHADPNSDQNILIGGSAENVRAVLGARSLQVQSSNAILNGVCE